MFRSLCNLLAVVALLAWPASTLALEIRWSVRGEPLALGTEPRFAGAVSSLRFRGVEYLDASDHGRLLQGAISFEDQGECLNPTLAGASSDRGRSTSRLLTVEAGPRRYVTVTRMAYWLRPGQSCRGSDGAPRPAANRSRLSDVVHGQRLTPGWRGQANAIHHAIEFTTSIARRKAVVEALTAYTPPGFSDVFLYDAKTDRVSADPEVRESPGEQELPAILATPGGRSAIALFSPDPAARYGRFALPETNKINVVFRPRGIYAPGTHAYEVVTVVGTLAEVQATLRAFHEQAHQL